MFSVMRILFQNNVMLLSLQRIFISYNTKFAHVLLILMHSH